MGVATGEDATRRLSNGASPVPQGHPLAFGRAPDRSEAKRSDSTPQSRTKHQSLRHFHFEKAWLTHRDCIWQLYPVETPQASALFAVLLCGVGG
jgi:hypothetical protein